MINDNFLVLAPCGEIITTTETRNQGINLAIACAKSAVIKIFIVICPDGQVINVTPGKVWENING